MLLMMKTEIYVAPYECTAEFGKEKTETNLKKTDLSLQWTESASM